MGNLSSAVGLGRTTGTEVEMQNRFELLEESEEEESPCSLVDSDSEEEEEPRRSKEEPAESEDSDDEDLMELLKQSVGQVWKVVRSKRKSKRRSKENRDKERRSCDCCKTQSASQEQ